MEKALTQKEKELLSKYLVIKKKEVKMTTKIKKLEKEFEAYWLGYQKYDPKKDENLVEKPIESFLSLEKTYGKFYGSDIVKATIELKLNWSKSQINRLREIYKEKYHGGYWNQDDNSDALNFLNWSKKCLTVLSALSYSERVDWKATTFQILKELSKKD